jgi:hypothetical protein
MHRHWIEGGKNGVTLHAPKGLAIVGDVLWVADIDTLRAFDRTSGAPCGEVAIPGARSLSDVTAATDGTLYASDADRDAGAIWRIAWPEPSPSGSLVNLHELVPRIEPLVRGGELGEPRGLVAYMDAVYCVSGRDGCFVFVDQRGVVTLLAKTGTPLDGLARIDPRPGESPMWLATSPAGRCLYQFEVTGAVTKLPRELDAPGDCGFDAVRRRLLVPLSASNRLELLQL